MKSVIQKFAEKFYLTYARARCKQEVLDFSDCLVQALTALIITPRLPREQQAALRLLTELPQIFPETHFSVLLEESFAAPITVKENLQLITYSVDDIAYYGLPRKKLQDAVSGRHFDLVVDLHESFDLVATCLCLVSDAKLRVALQHPKRDFLYNFQVRVADHLSLDLKYDSLIKYLTCFRVLPHASEAELLTV